MNQEGIGLFRSKVKVGDEISVRSTKYEDMIYFGEVYKITDDAVWIRSNMRLDLFETLAIPAFEEFKFQDIWWYNVA